MLRIGTQMDSWKCRCYSGVSAEARFSDNCPLCTRLRMPGSRTLLMLSERLNLPMLRAETGIASGPARPRPSA